MTEPKKNLFSLPYLSPFFHQNKPTIMLLRVFNYCLFLSGVTLLSCVFGCHQNDVEKYLDVVKLNEDNFKQISIYSTKNGTPQFFIKGDSLCRKHTMGGIEPVAEFYGHVNAEFYDIKTHKLQTKAISKFCRVNEKTHSLYLKDSVYIVTKTGDKIHSKDLTWDDRKQIFFTHDSFTIYRPTETLRGIGFESNADATTYKVYKGMGSATSKTLDF